MSERYRINLLIPYLDGEYYGTIFTTLQQEANRTNSTLFTIQALASVENPTAFDYQIGTEVMDGWLLMTNPNSALPSSPRFLKAIEASGKPVVTIGYQEDSIACHSVVIDNRQAIKDAVLHLIRDHGHEQIAFVGGTEHVDLIERFAGYKEALQESGIAYAEQLYFQAANTLRHGGVTAAEEMMARGMNFTAVVAATDLNAMGIIDRLQAAGYRIPEDLAVIGFDDLPASSTFDPPLSTIHQPIADLAQVSYDHLLRQMKGEPLPHAVTYIPTRFVPRSSCGCTYETKVETIEVLRHRLQEAEAVVDHLIRRHNQLAGSWATAARGESFDFASMFSGISQWGCLAMWESNREDRKHLIVKQAFGKPSLPIGTKIPIEQFPPINWLPHMEENEFVRVQPIRSDREDLGFIVLVGPIDQLVLVSEVDITRISCNISVTALERDKLFNEVRSIADQLEIVSRTTNDGIWNWDIPTNRIQWSPRTHDMIQSIGETLTSDPDSFFRLVDPEDYDRVMSALRNHIDHGGPFKIEFRIQGKQKDQQLWLYAAGDSIRNENGKNIRMIGSLTNITEKKQAEKQLAELAYHDVLTGLPNRMRFQDRFVEHKEEADANNYKLGIMLVDLDQFKFINDTWGHQTGDQLLQEVARMLKRVVSVDGIVARLGGDEFIILLTGLQDEAQLQQTADRITRQFQQPFVIEQREIFTTASIGMSVYPDDGANLKTLTRAADTAMYNAKEKGKNRSEMYRFNNGFNHK